MVIGIDLAAREYNPTGLCVKQGSKNFFKTFYSNEEIISFVKNYNPKVIAIDSPIMKGESRIREADKLMHRYGALPPTMQSMKLLTIRGTKLSEELSKNYKVIEVFPTATAKILGIYNKNYRKTADLLNISIRNKHEFDAYLCCITAEYYIRGETVAVGDEEGRIIIPYKRVDSHNIERNQFQGSPI